MHQGTLPREPELRDMVLAREAGKPDDGELELRLQDAVALTVRKQLEVGMDVINDGELSKSNFAYYVRNRLGTHEELATDPPHVMSARDRVAFPGYFSQATIGKWARHYVVTEPLEYQGYDAVRRDAERLRAALDAAHGAGQVDGVLMSIAPGTIEHWLHNQHYPGEEAFLSAIADAMHEEYRAITDAGLLVQIDDPDLPDAWQSYPDFSVADYRRYAELRVEALNHALRGIPPEQVIVHICWGSYHTPHVNDLPLRDIVDILFKVRAQGLSVEQSNPRHEHEWRVFEDVKLPDDKVLIPGVVGHVTDVVEHPDLVAERLVNYAQLVGRENVVAGTDCGIGSRVAHAEVTWSKLAALAEGARRATTRLRGD
jgi:5-methyltetrahydropteroyltriglutamate--homocysteine methyltransferase